MWHASGPSSSTFLFCFHSREQLYRREGEEKAACTLRWACLKNTVFCTPSNYATGAKYFVEHLHLQSNVKNMAWNEGVTHHFFILASLPLGSERSPPKGNILDGAWKAQRNSHLLHFCVFSSSTSFAKALRQHNFFPRDLLKDILLPYLTTTSLH